MSLLKYPDTMNRKQLFEEFASGRDIGKIKLFSPILMHFAARHIDRSYAAFASDYRVLVEANIRAMGDFGMDMVSLISDPYRETAAFGARIEFPEEAVPRCIDKVIKSTDDIHSLKVPDVYKNERTLDRIKGAEEYSRILKGEVPVIGWIEGPLAEACDLAGVSEMLMMLMMDPDSSGLLLDKCTEMAKKFAAAQVEAGCDIIGMGDAVCSQVDPDTYSNFVMGRQREIISFIHGLGARVKLHICGDISHLLPLIKETGADIIDLDWQVSPGKATEILGHDTILCGNINPVLIQDKPPDEVFLLTEKLINENSDRKLIVSAGCEITVDTPAENLKAMARAAKSL